MIDYNDLENAGFRVQGIAQALQALSTSELVVHQIGWALDILARAAEGAAKTIDDAVAARPKPIGETQRRASQ